MIDEAPRNVRPRRSPMNVCIITAHYPPAYKAGGPVRSISAMADVVGERHQLRVITSDYDFPNIKLDGIKNNTWTRVGNADVCYVSRARQNPLSMASLITEAAPDVLYLSSFWANHTIMCLGLRRMRLLPDVPIIVAPRGEFAPSALRLRPIKKRLAMVAARLSGVLETVTWHASSEYERADIQSIIGPAAEVYVAPNLAPPVDARNFDVGEKSKGTAKLVTVGRVCRMKNIAFALERLANVTGKVEFTIIGPLEDAAYVDECEARARELPPNIQVKFAGALPHERVIDCVRQSDAFVSLTLGENFGHAIFEALSVGCPVLISDRTPWKGLAARGAGWDLSLDRKSEIEQALQALVLMSNEDLGRMRAAAYAVAAEITRNPERTRANLSMFDLVRA